MASPTSARPDGPSTAAATVSSIIATLLVNGLTVAVAAVVDAKDQQTYLVFLAGVAASMVQPLLAGWRREVMVNVAANIVSAALIAFSEPVARLARADASVVPLIAAAPPQRGRLGVVASSWAARLPSA